MNNGYYIGIHSGHNSSACLLKDGEVLQCVSEERYTNVKNQDGFPGNAFDNILKDHELGIENVSAFCFAGNGTGPIFSGPLAEEEGATSKIITLGKHLGLNRIDFCISTFYKLFYPRLCVAARKKELALFTEKYAVPRGKIRLYDHHSCHAAAAYFGSPFNADKALVFTLDSEGDSLCATVSIGEGGKLKRIAETPMGNSLGDLYMYITLYLGMKPGEHEYKVMGLAPYARDSNRTYQTIKDYIGFADKHGLIFKATYDTHLSYSRFRKAMEGHRFDNIAGAFQQMLTEKVTQWVKNGIKNTSIKKICLGGGVFMNVKANNDILNIGEVDRLFVFPSCSDESLAVGAAYLGSREHESGKEIKQIKALYWGDSFTNDQVKQCIKDHKLENKYKVSFKENIEEIIAQYLSENKIVAILSGKMEFGARALGNRSILANPMHKDNVRIINEKMKHRDFWMPFACSILEETVNEYVIIPKEYKAYYMMVAFPSTLKAREHLIAGMHPYDFTLRPQIVKQQHNPKYHKILTEFRKLTGIGGVLNTSFNLHGMPIVRGPNEAIQAFEHSGIKCLVMENYLIEKHNQTP